MEVLTKDSGGRAPTEIIEVFRNNNLNLGAQTIFNTQFPLGEPWYRMLLWFQFVLTIGTGTTALSEGELQIIKSLRMRTDKNEVLINSVPGRFLYRMDSIKSGTAGPKDAIAAASATYNVWLPIWFVDPLLHRPEDTILDTSRYSSLQLEINLGTIANLLGTPGTATVTASVSGYVDRMRARLPEGAKPSLYCEYGLAGQPVDPTGVTEINPERAQNLSYKRLYAAGTTGSTSGVPYSGSNSDSIFNDLTVEDSTGFPFNTVLDGALQRENKQFYMLESLMSGLRVIDFVRDKSLMAQLYSGDKSRLKLKWSDASLPATPQVTLAYEATRPLI